MTVASPVCDFGAKLTLMEVMCVGRQGGYGKSLYLPLKTSLGKKKKNLYKKMKKMLFYEMNAKDETIYTIIHISLFHIKRLQPQLRNLSMGAGKLS